MTGKTECQVAIKAQKQAMKAQTKALAALAEEADDVLGLSIYDDKNPRSVFHMLPPLTRAGIQRIPEPLRKLNEEQLRKDLDPDATLCRLRISFWEEYERASVRGTHVSLTKVTQGVCTRDYWDSVIVINEKYLAWILCPPKDYMLSMKELLDLGLNRLREIVNLPFADPKTGRLNPAVVAQVLAAIQMLDARVKGAIVQKLAVKQQSSHLHAHVGAAMPGTGGKRQEALVAPIDAHQIEGTMEELEKLEAKLGTVSARLEQRAAEYVVGPGGKDHLDMEPAPNRIPNAGHPRKKPEAPVEDAELIDEPDDEDNPGGM